ncbi:MAG: ABC transporter substrate-binding protein [Candidatus Methylacidiphilales bacterium]|nr:ABC transporter substrate-binding protein [Candidatus Methylacidiphilales bacterium]
MRRLCSLFLCPLTWLTVLCPPPYVHGSPASPRHIVSINLVSDIILLDLVEPERITALSWLASDPDTSPVAERARAFPKTRGHAEEILPLKPDLVVGTAWGQDRTLQLIERTGIRTHRVLLAQRYAEIESAVRDLARAVGESEKGEALIERMNARLAALRDPNLPPRGTAVWLGQQGFHHGDDHLMREILRDAGWIPSGSGSISLESLVLHPPDAVIETRYLTDRPTLASRLRDHPALRSLAAEIHVVRLADLLSATHLMPSVSENLRRQTKP